MVRNTVNYDTKSPVMKLAKVGFNREERLGEKTKEHVGVIKVYIHQARDIHDICIYGKQDVYAKIYLTNDPKVTVCTKTISGGGKNPVFNETLKLYVPKIDNSLLKCEIWILSRVQNYLQDQLLGFALVPLYEILSNVKVEREFSLSSSDLFHFQAGFVQLSVEYFGPTPHVIEISMTVDDVLDVHENVSSELAKIEFPDPELADENECMVSKYFEDSKTKLKFPSVDELDSVEHSSDKEVPSIETPGSNASDSSLKVVQQEIVDMYMKSMHQFTESLAKMKLPLDLDNGRNADSGEKLKVVWS